ncbi:MAG: hypothetical protein KGL12_05280 [Rhodospirillales bacterium]|nr:hypothetical protein [Rhodospirillales bacterium]
MLIDLLSTLIALGVFVLLTASALFGRFVRARLPEVHRTRETIEAMQIVIGMLVTFTALVMGLMTNSVKTAYDRAGHDLQAYALGLTRLDTCLRDYGPETAAAQAILRRYTATLIASTWVNEKPPAWRVPGPDRVAPIGPSPVLGGELNQVYLHIRHLAPTDGFHAGVRDDCIAAYHALIRGRLAAIEDDRQQVSRPFDVILVVWLMIIFAVFGLISPRNIVSLIGMGLCAVSLSLAIFVLASLSHPYFVVFPSADMRAALAAMMAPAP